ncbi:hypothetical protein JX265_008296 [Neoarthrinium moseri]|uniref:FAS1 domain-containing protein n=1 Tax=Neoarthrinium moseri TaxID=1658444 RepID=A0A9Q0AP07_9PEZI|nr:hypothetical protein JX265_008296 [Neoarthrinium moseri]
MHIPTLIPWILATAAAEPIANVLAANSNELSTLTSLLGTVPQLTTALATASNITIFAPSNQAFTKAMAAMPDLATMAKNTTFLTNLLEYHIASGVMTAAMFTNTPQFASTALTLPSTASGTIRTQMVELVKSNADALVVSGFRQVSRVSKADLFFDGGVLHIIDTVLTVPDTTSATALDTGLTSLAGALARTGMVAGVDALRQATVFAPSNEAFREVGNVVESADMEFLSSVLDYHVVMGTAAHSTELMQMVGASGGSAKLLTAQGGMLTVREENGDLYVNNAKVILADMLTSNGVVHIIDNVMNPLSTTSLPDASREKQAVDFAGASSVSQAPFTSGVSPTATLVPVTIARAGGFAAMPTAALMGAVGAAAVMANM